MMYYYFKVQKYKKITLRQISFSQPNKKQAQHTDLKRFKLFPRNLYFDKIE